MDDELIRVIKEVLEYVPKSYRYDVTFSPPCRLSQKIYEIITDGNPEIGVLLEIYTMLRDLYTLRLVKELYKDNIDYVFDSNWDYLKDYLNVYLEGLTKEGDNESG